MERKIDGVVVRGNGLGARLGFPTANVDVKGGIPDNGVYAATVVLETEERLPAVVNIGSRPTVTDDPRRVVEAHIIGFRGDLYGQRIAVVLVKFIRKEEKFASVEELVAKMEEDKLNAIKILNHEI